MTGPLKAALALSVGIHASLFLGWPTTTPVAFDVERAPTSLEILLVAPRATPTLLQPVAEFPTPEVPSAMIPEVLPEPDHAPQTIVTPEFRGALSEVLPRYLRNPPPIYPWRSRQRGEEGAVLLAAEVLPTGRCGALMVVSSSGFVLLDEAALTAVTQWQFKPARRSGHPVGVWVEIPIRFQLIETGD